MSKLSTLFRYFFTPKKFKSREQIERIQRKGMRKQAKFVRKNSPFYARHWDGMQDEQWSEFPLIDKSIMMENLEDLLTVRLDVDKARKLQCRKVERLFTKNRTLFDRLLFRNKRFKRHAFC